MPSYNSMGVSLKIVESTLLYAEGLLDPAESEQVLQVRLVLRIVITTIFNFSLIIALKKTLPIVCCRKMKDSQ